MSAQGVRIEDKQIEVVKNWPKPTSVKNIEVFICFANFYRRFIQALSKIATLLTSMLKKTRSPKHLALKAFKTDDNEVVGGVGGNSVNETVKNLSKSKKSKNKKSKNLMHIKTTGKPYFLTFIAKEAFNRLR